MPTYTIETCDANIAEFWESYKLATNKKAKTTYLDAVNIWLEQRFQLMEEGRVETKDENTVLA